MLKEWIRDGVLSDVLPGEMDMKARLGVGRDTLRLALKQLTDEGLLFPAVKGRQRQLRDGGNPSRARARVRSLPVILLSAHPIEERTDWLFVQGTRARLAGWKALLEHVEPAIFELHRPEKRLEQLTRANPAAAWILNKATRPVQRWFDQRGVPAVILDLPFRGVHLPFVAPDWEAAGFDAGVQLMRKGHRIIGILERQGRIPRAEAGKRGLRRAIEEQEPAGQMVVLKHDSLPASAARALESAYRLAQRPTALVLTCGAQLLTCYSWLVSQGIRIASEVSLVSLPNERWFSELHPPANCYRPDSKRMSQLIAEQIIELVNTGTVAQSSIQVPMRRVPGGTVGPAPDFESFT